ncbi:MAG: hypothetical protein RR482_05690 [Clostridia bacterium]
MPAGTRGDTVGAARPGACMLGVDVGTGLARMGGATAGTAIVDIGAVAPNAFRAAGAGRCVPNETGAAGTARMGAAEARFVAT